MGKSTEEDRVLVSPDGHGATVGVSRIGPGRYRIEDFIRFSFWGDDDMPEEAGVGWVLQVEELEDGRLVVEEIVEDPGVDCISGALLPARFARSAEFERLADQIVELGGNWEVFARGMFSAYVPKDAARRSSFVLAGALEDAVDRWTAASDS